MRVIEGGKPKAGEKVLVDGAREASVLCSSFGTFVFRGDVSVCFGDGTLGLVSADRIERRNGETPRGGRGADPGLFGEEG